MSDRKKKNIGAYQGGQGLSMYVRGAAAMGRLGAQLLSKNLPSLWLLRGPLGAGKTTLVRGVIHSLGLRQPVSSPTFAIVKHYRARRPPEVLHVDAYRIRHPQEIPALGLWEGLERPGVLVLIEWPERLGKIRWPARTIITIRHAPGGRRVTVRTVGARPLAGHRKHRRPPSRVR